MPNSSGDRDGSLSNIDKDENSIDIENDVAFLTRYENDGNFIS